MKANPQLHKSREARIGSVDFANQRLHFTLGYTKCEHCNHRIKVVATPDEARNIAQAFGYKRLGLKARLAIKLQKWASDV